MPTPQYPIEDFMDKTLEVWRKSSRKSDGLGGITRAEELKGTYKGMIDPLNVSKKIEYRKLEYSATHNIYINNSPDIIEGDKIKCGNRTFTVLSVMSPGEAGDHLEIEVEEVK